MQKPTPQLNVFNISLSDIFLLLSHLKILPTFIFDKSIFIDNLSGTYLIKFSIKPPPVIWAAELIKFLLTNLRISFE